MKTTMKKVLSMSLALVLLLGTLPMAALATENHTWKPKGADGHYCIEDGCTAVENHFDNNGNNIWEGVT